MTSSRISGTSDELPWDEVSDGDDYSDNDDDDDDMNSESVNAPNAVATEDSNTTLRKDSFARTTPGAGSGASGGSKRSKKKWKAEVDYHTICKLIRRLTSTDVTSKKRGGGGGEDMLAAAEGAILVFLPGTAEISRLISMLKYTSGVKGGGNGETMLLLPLHGGLSNAEQKKVFERPPRGTVKVPYCAGHIV